MRKSNNKNIEEFFHVKLVVVVAAVWCWWRWSANISFLLFFFFLLRDRWVADIMLQRSFLMLQTTITDAAISFYIYSNAHTQTQTH